MTADILVLAARMRGRPLLRLNQDSFPRDIQIIWGTSGELVITSPRHCFTAEDIAGAWFRREPNSKAVQSEDFATRESAGFLRGIWETMPWAWMNAPSAVRRTESKLVQLRCAASAGFDIPQTLVTNDVHAARSFVGSRQAIAKTVVGAGLTLRGAKHAIFTMSASLEHLASDKEVEACPVIFQERIETGYDLRVTVVGSEVFAARIIVVDRNEGEVDWRQIDEKRLRYEIEHLSDEFRSRCVAFVTGLGLSYGALDFVVGVDGRRVFLELNPSGQWVWIERALQLPITAAILDHLGRV